jgi:hypothetical protein
MSACYCACSICMSGSCCQNRWSDPYRIYYIPPYYPYLPMGPYPDYPLSPTGTTNMTLKFTLPCSKCGSTSIWTKWHKDTNFSNNDAGRCSYEERNDWPTDDEHLHRTCQDCGYHWATAVIGASK